MYVDQEKKLEHPHILAELSFGFLRFLTTKKYLTILWTPAIQYAFPFGNNDIWERQKQVSKALTTMTFIRNRAAHLEPVFRRDLKMDFNLTCILMEWINPDARAWFE